MYEGRVDDVKGTGASVILKCTGSWATRGNSLSPGGVQTWAMCRTAAAFWALAQPSPELCTAAAMRLKDMSKCAVCAPARHCPNKALYLPRLECQVYLARLQCQFLSAVALRTHYGDRCYQCSMRLCTVSNTTITRQG